MRFGINVLPASLLAPQFEASALAERVRGVGLSPGQIVIECTEQQAFHDVPALKKQVRALRHLGFGFAVDNAGAGYASFTVIAALEPTIIKIDHEIVQGVGNKDAEAKKALVEAFVSFSRAHRSPDRRRGASRTAATCWPCRIGRSTSARATCSAGRPPCRYSRRPSATWRT